MPRYRTAYLPEFRRQTVDLARSGGTPRAWRPVPVRFHKTPLGRIFD